MSWIIAAYLLAGIAVSWEIMTPVSHIQRHAPIHAAIVAVLVVLLWPFVAARLGYLYRTDPRRKK